VQLGPHPHLGRQGHGSSPPDWLQADEQIIKPLVKTTAAKYAAEKKLTPRTRGLPVLRA